MSLVRHTLSNVILPTSADPLGGWDLYCKHESLSADRADRAAEAVLGEGLSFSGTLDFFTYFNACSLGKWKRYAQIEEVTLELVVDDLNCVIGWVGRSEGDAATQTLVSGSRLSYFACEETEQGLYRVTIPVPKTDKQVVGFVLQAREAICLKSGVYYTMVDESQVNPVVLALCTTTFKKEDYIIPNIEMVKEEIIGSDEPIASHFQMFVIDNGQTLDGEALSTDQVHVIPNKNVGGSGGFARGMMEAMASDTGVTHVLLMDDDVSVSTESIKRTFNLLSLRKGKYLEAFINGAMLPIEEPYRLFEDVSYVRRSGGYCSIKKDLMMNEAADIVQNEAIDVEVPNAYGAWWFCCIPVKRIQEVGLPLPLFIRCDDVDYGIRSQPIYMTMNGICVWHAGFEDRFRPSVDCYQYIRNYLITIAVNQMPNEKFFMARIMRDVHLNMRFMAYDTVELILDGLADYLKGPEFIMRPNGDVIMQEKGKKNEVMVPYEELDLECLSSVPAGKELQAKEFTPKAQFIKLWRTLPYDRHLVPQALLHDRMGRAIYTSAAHLAVDSALTTRIAAVDHHGEVAAVRTIDHDRYRALMDRWHALQKDYRKRGKAVREAYAAAKPKLTSWEFWNEYLGTDLHLNQD